MAAGFGNIPPFFTNYGAASATSPGILTTSAQTKAGVMTFQDGVVFNTLTATGATTATALTETLVGTTDTGTNPIGVRNHRIGASTAVVTRPIWSDQNNGTNVLQLLPLNSGADACLKFPTSGNANPAFTTRSSGNRLVISDAISGSSVDYAVGVGVNAMWFSVATTAKAFNFFGGQTLAMTLFGSGQLQTVGGKVRKTRIALTTPVTVAITDDIVEINLTTPGAVTINYPSSPVTGTEFVFQDGKGDAGANNHTHTPAAGNINGAGTKVYATNYYRATAYYNATQWLIG